LENDKSVVVRCWGTRGSIPSPGPDTTRYGGNTSCVEIEAGASRIIFDAGTGIRRLGKKVVSEGEEKDATVFLTHFHWDHIQGLPFFSPVHEPDFRLRILAPAQEGVDSESLICGMMGPVYFPLPFDDFPAEITFEDLGSGAWESGDLRVRSMRMRHTAHTVGFRLEAAGHSVVYIPDNELIGGAYPVADGWYDRLVQFIADADLLLHDAMFTPQEYSQKEGWGHSTFDQALALAERAGVGKLRFFHHDPGRSDEDLIRIVRSYQGDLDRRKSGLDLRAAEEGVAITLGPEIDSDRP
jgi:phosphoribosyl 1,2-cyclic phosphodiesterase